jgi:hypothetical protein
MDDKTKNDPAAAAADAAAEQSQTDKLNAAKQISAVASGPPRKYPWADYKPGEKDVNGNKIDSIHARCDEFVIYFCKDDGTSDLYFECTEELLATTESPSAQLAKINRLVTENERKRRKTLECVADAFEMWLCGQHNESLQILKDIVAQLEMWRTTKGRMYYQFSALVAPVLLWIIYIVIVGFSYSDKGLSSLTFIFDALPWLLAAALGATGGFFSVCLNLPKITVNMNQEIKDLLSAGGTRAAIALIAAVACLLAFRGKIILGLAEPAAPLAEDIILSAPVMFFLFLAGFSETFIPNVLRDAEKNHSGGNGANGSSASSNSAAGANNTAGGGKA